MRRPSRFLTLLPQLVVAATLAPGCDIQDQEAPVEERLCERFDECNFLAPGFAVDDCIDTQFQCTDGFVDSQYEDWKADMQECLSLNSCGNTFDCWESIPACGGGGNTAGGGSGGSGGNGSGGNPPSNQAQFQFECDEGSFQSTLNMNVEIVPESGITWGSGPSPDITGVIGTGNNHYYTSGTMQIPDRTYQFSGEGNFADFWSDVPGDRNTSEFKLQSNGDLILVWDWFGAATEYPCRLISSGYV